MLHESLSPADSSGRRRFLKSLSAGAAGLALGSLAKTGDASAKLFGPDKSEVSFLTGKDRRDMVFRALKPFEKG